MKSSGRSVVSKSRARKTIKKRIPTATSRLAEQRTLAAAAKNAAISTELAPAVAIALLEKSEQAAGDPPAALDVFAAGVTASEIEGNVRVQLLFENGMVLPVEMTEAAGAALSDGLAENLPKARK